MKKTFLLFLLCILRISAIQAQDYNGYSNKGKDRISFVLGVSGAALFTKPYQNLVVNKTSNYVIVERADAVKTSGAFGFMYTLGNKQQDNTSGTSGWSFGVFFNPFDITATNTTKASALDVGAGVGYRLKRCAILLSYDVVSLRQPKDYFINLFQNNNNVYSVGPSTQTSIDVNDNIVYRNKSFSAIALKLVVPIDL